MKFHFSLLFISITLLFFTASCRTHRVASDFQNSIIENIPDYRIFECNLQATAFEADIDSNSINRDHLLLFVYINSGNTFNPELLYSKTFQFDSIGSFVDFDLTDSIINNSSLTFMLFSLDAETKNTTLDSIKTEFIQFPHQIIQGDTIQDLNHDLNSRLLGLKRFYTSDMLGSIFIIKFENTSINDSYSYTLRAKSKFCFKYAL